MEYYSELKREELSSHEKKWRKLKCLLLSERNQSEKATLHDIAEKTKLDDKSIIDSQGFTGSVGEQEGRTGEQSVFTALKPFCMILQQWIHGVHLSKPTKLYNIRSEP